MHEIAVILENRKNSFQLMEALRSIPEEEAVTGTDLAERLPKLNNEKIRTLILLLKTAGILITIQPALSAMDYLMKVNISALDEFEKQILLLVDVLPEKSRPSKYISEEGVKIVATMPDFLYKEGEPPRVPSVSSTMARLITRAEKTIWIVNPFFDEFAVAFIHTYLNAAANRGVKINIITRPPATNDSNAASIRFLKENLEKTEQLEVRSFYSKKNDEWCSIHSKILLIDDATCYIGSANITRGSFNRNFEMGVVLTGEIVKEPAQIISNIWKTAHPVKT